jgi:hypothetical protein
MSTRGNEASSRGLALMNFTFQRASRSFWRSFAGLSFHSRGSPLLDRLIFLDGIELARSRDQGGVDDLADEIRFTLFRYRLLPSLASQPPSVPSSCSAAQRNLNAALEPSRAQSRSIKGGNANGGATLGVRVRRNAIPAGWRLGRLVAQNR